MKTYIYILVLQFQPVRREADLNIVGLHITFLPNVFYWVLQSFLTLPHTRYYRYVVDLLTSSKLTYTNSQTRNNNL